MIVQKRWGFGFGTIFSLIVVYFIHLYSKKQGWALLALISKLYLIIVSGLILLSLGIILLVLLFSLLMVLLSMIKIRSINKKHKKQKDYIDAEFKVKDE